jgi:hypothetical protein
LGKFSELFVDANILKVVVPVKNQIIYGRRGTGKTHLLGRLNEYYRENFAELRILPVYIDGRNIAFNSTMAEANSVISILISYRRFLDAIITSLKDFVDNTIVLSSLEKLWPGGTEKNKLLRIRELIDELILLIRFGEVEIAQGKAESEHRQADSKEHSSQLAFDFKIASDVKKLAENNASFSAGLKRADSSSAAENLKVVYEGLTVINYIKVRECIEELIAILNAEALVVLFDEWSAINTSNQPILAEMIRSTLVGGRRFGIKFACIPFYTRISDSDESGQSIGFPIGEEVFVDVDFDRLCNPFMNPNNVTLFLLSILQKHLAAKISDFKQATLEEWTDYCLTEIFESKAAIEELVKASAGVPRDFLRMFSRAFRIAEEKLPLNERVIRIAMHEFFRDEKQTLIEKRPRASSLYESIFNEICIPTNAYIFFVSSKYAKSVVLQEIWHHRLIHLLFQGHMAYAQGKLGT